jgi:hypothetical protein
MKGLIQRFPSGLLALLNIKSDETPRLLEETLAGSLDLEKYYLSERLEVVTATLVGTTLQINQTIPVPAGESWFLYGVHAIASSITAASSVMLGCGIQDSSGNAFLLNGMTAPVVTVAGQLVSIVGQPSQPIILKPGMAVFAGTQMDPGAGTLDLQCRALIARLNPS